MHLAHLCRRLAALAVVVLWPGWAVAQGNWGLVTPQGTWLLSPAYDSIGAYAHGLAPARLGGKWGYLGLRGQVVLPVEYDSAAAFQLVQGRPLGQVWRGQASGWLMPDGTWLVPPCCPTLPKPTEHGFVILTDTQGQAGLFHLPTGRQVLANRFAALRWAGPGRLWAQEAEGGPWGLWDTAGQLRAAAMYTQADTFWLGLAPVQRGNQWGLMDASGAEAIAPTHPEGTHALGRGYYLAKDRGRWTIHRLEDGVDAGFPAIDSLLPAGPGVLWAKRGRRWGLMAAPGGWRQGPRYEAVYPLPGGVARVRRGKHWGLADTMGFELVPLQFDALTPIGPGLLRTTANGRHGLVRHSGEVLRTAEYEALTPFREGRAAFRQFGGWAYLDTLGQERFPPNADSLLLPQGGYAPVQLAGRWGLVDTNGNEWLVPIFRSVGYPYQGHMHVQNEDGWGLANLNAEIVVLPAWDAIRGPYQQALAVQRGPYWGLQDTLNQLLMPPQFVDINLPLPNAEPPAEALGTQQGQPIAVRTAANAPKGRNQR